MELPFTQKPNKPFIVPTYYGLAYFLLVMNVFGLGYYRNSGPFHTVGLTLIVLGLVAMVQSSNNILYTELESVHHLPSEAGKMSRIEVSLSNKGIDSRYNIKVELEKKYKPVEAETVDEVAESESVTLKIQPLNRGVYKISRIKVSSKGVYGLFYVWKWLPCEEEIVIYPSPLGSSPPPALRGMSGQNSDDGEDFTGHSLHLEGQPLRRIDWKAFARCDKLLVKNFEKSFEGPLELIYDETPGEYTEAKLQQLSSWILEAERTGRAFSLSMPLQSLPSGNSKDHLVKALHMLARFQEPAA